MVVAIGLPDYHRILNKYDTIILWYIYPSEKFVTRFKTSGRSVSVHNIVCKRPNIVLIVYSVYDVDRETREYMYININASKYTEYYIISEKLWRRRDRSRF